MNLAELAQKLNALSARIDKECSDFLAKNWRGDDPDSPRSLMRKKLEYWRLDLEALGRTLEQKQHEQQWQRHWRTKESALGKQRELDQARRNLFHALGRVEATMLVLGETPLEKSLVDLIKNFASTTSKVLTKEVKALNVPNDVKAKLSATSSDASIIIVIASAVLLRWVGKLRETR